MAGTKEGGLKAAATNLARDPDFYRKIGSLGGSVCSKDKGFGSNRQLASIAGAVGGRKSKRGPAIR